MATKTDEDEKQQRYSQSDTTEEKKMRRWGARHWAVNNGRNKDYAT